jgi:hypothetical protein
VTIQRKIFFRKQVQTTTTALAVMLCVGYGKAIANDGPPAPTRSRQNSTPNLVCQYKNPTYKAKVSPYPGESNDWCEEFTDERGRKFYRVKQGTYAVSCTCELKLLKVAAGSCANGATCPDPQEFTRPIVLPPINRVSIWNYTTSTLEKCAEEVQEWVDALTCDKNSVVAEVPSYLMGAVCEPTGRKWKLPCKELPTPDAQASCIIEESTRSKLCCTDSSNPETCSEVVNSPFS